MAGRPSTGTRRAALEIEAELAGDDYEATPDELTAIDEGVAGEAASDEEIKAAFASFRQA